MTLVDPSASTPRRNGASAAGDTASRSVRGLWAVIWNLSVPLLIGFYVHQRFGATAGGWPVAGLAAVVVAVLVCAVMRAIGADVALGLVPTVAVVGAYLVNQPTWAGLAAGLVVGGLWFAIRRRR